MRIKMNWDGINRVRYMLAGLLLLVLLWLLVTSHLGHSSSYHTTLEAEFTLPPYSQEWYGHTCFGNKLINPDKTADLSTIVSVIKPWRQSSNPHCRSLFERFSHIYHVHQSSGSLLLPDTLMEKFKESGFSKELLSALSLQNVTIITNVLTHESNMFNPVRNMRPMVVQEITDREYIEQLAKKTAENCDFCNYKRFTSVDSIGRLESRYTFTAANSFKFEGWHTLILFKQHHPLNWTREHFLDMFNLALQWISKVHEATPSYCHANMLWDLLPKAGASQVHPHLQVTVSDDRYHETLQMWRDVAGQYLHTFPSHSYFSDQLEIHHALGLTLQYGTAAAYASLTPRKDNEMVIFGKSANVDFFHLLFVVLKGFQQEMEQLCFSMGLALQPLGDGEWADDIPVFARVVTRGPAAEIRSDISSLELFGASNVNQSPYMTIQALRRMLQEQASVKDNRSS